MFLLLALGNVVTVTTYMIDHTAAARRFDGIGALSGGGTTSKLLPDYHSELVTSTSNFKHLRPCSCAFPSKMITHILQSS